MLSVVDSELFGVSFPKTGFARNPAISAKEIFFIFIFLSINFALVNFF